MLVDYFVELDDISDEVSTLQIKRFFHDALTPTSLPDSVHNETTDEKQSSAVPQVKETFMLGKFVLDPVSTDFIGNTLIRKRSFFYLINILINFSAT